GACKAAARLRIRLDGGVDLGIDAGEQIGEQALDQGLLAPEMMKQSALGDACRRRHRLHRDAGHTMVHGDRRGAVEQGAAHLLGLLGAGVGVCRHQCTVVPENRLMTTTPDTISAMPTKAAASSIWRNSTKETVAVR